MHIQTLICLGSSLLLDKKKEIIARMQKLMREKRAEIDPKVLAMARDAAERKQGLAPTGKTVPYDRDAAEKAVALFLKAHPDQKRFRAQLLAMMTKKSH